MEKELPITYVEDINGNKYYLEKVLGQGGQGMVCRTKDENLAVKFLMKNDKIVENQIDYESFKNKIEDVVIMNFDSDIKLCKPEIMLKKPVCGYIMKLLSNLRPINELIYDPNSDTGLQSFYIKTQGLKKRVEVLLELSRTLARIHSKGIVYCDISPNNVFYSDTKNFSNVWLIDCDNLKFVGNVKKGIFTPGYGAPEVVANLTGNTIFSDCFSFAVLAFKVLTNRNPFEENYDSVESDSDGWDASATEPASISGNKVPWLFENGMTEELKDYFKHFIDSELLELFNKTFNEKGRIDPTSRPSMRMWYEVLKVTNTRINKCNDEEYIFSSENKCPFCEKNRAFKHHIQIVNVFKREDFVNIVDKVLDNAYKDNLDLEFSPKSIDSIKKTFYEKKYDNSLIVYDGLKLYNFNLFDITIFESPFPILEFKYHNNILFVTNKAKLTISLRYKEVALNLNFGETHQLSGSGKDVFNLYLIDPVSKAVVCVRVFSI